MENELSVDFCWNKQLYNINISINTGKFRSLEEAKTWWNVFFNRFFSDHSELDPTQLKKVNERGVTLIDGTMLEHPDLFELSAKSLSAAQKGRVIWATMPFEPKNPVLQPDISKIAVPEPRLEVPGVAKVDYHFLPTDPAHPHFLDRIPQNLRWVGPSVQFYLDHLLLLSKKRI